MAIQRRPLLAAIGSGVAVGLSGCAALGADGGSGPESSGETVTLATTTSTYDTGLLDALNAPFEERYGVTVNTISDGTGAAIETGRRGDSDVVIVHARSQEDALIESGDAINRRDLMVNDYVILGPSDDPAGIAGDDDAVAAFEAIVDSESTFVSRGDNSGTHTRERDIWEAAGLETAEFGGWYRDAGQGMGAVIVQADRTDGYTLADRGTARSMATETDLEVHVDGPIDGGPALLANPYGIAAVNPAVHDSVHYDLAMAYIGFVTGTDGQAIIEDYTVEGTQLFVPAALTEDPEFGQYVPETWDGSDGDE